MGEPVGTEVGGDAGSSALCPIKSPWSTSWCPEEKAKEREEELKLKDPVAGGENGVKDLTCPPITTGDPNNNSTERTNS